jgi:hypothetical protein
MAAAKRLQLQQLGLLGRSLHPSKRLVHFDLIRVYCSDASMSIATIGGTTAKKYLQQALKKANPAEQNPIQSALGYLSYRSPVNRFPDAPSISVSANTAQQLLQIQDQMDKATHPIDQRRLLNQAEKIPGIGAFAFVAKI